MALLSITGCACQHEWLPADCVTPETCKLCGEIQGQALGHTWLDATCTDPKICTVCAKTEGERLGHSWLDATCTTPKICENCSLTKGKPLFHDWQEADCETPKTCNRCQKTEGEPSDHNWLEATCESGPVCQDCGITEGDPLGHDYLDATCLNPKTCSRCESTEGEALGHDWSKATCSKPGICDRCGEESGEALGHDWADATCILPKTCRRCNKTSGYANGHQLDATDGENKLCAVCGKSVTTKYVALTFDDGPSGDLTKKLLEGLAQRDVTSTFFVCGYRLKYYPSIPQLVLDYGHELGLHTFNHPNLKELSREEIRKELQDTWDLLPEGSNVTLMRPPGGNYNNRVKEVCKEMGLGIMLWSLDTRDWATNDVDEVVNKIVSRVKDGDVILMHELKNSSIQAALKAIDILKAQGYEFVTVSQLAAIKGETLEPGHVYTKP